MIWKSLALASTSIAALSFSATLAQAAPPPVTMGVIEIGATQWWDDYNYGSPSVYNYNWVSLNGAARVNMPYSRRTNIQVDFFGDASLDDGSHYFGGKGNGVGNVGAGIHFNWRDPEEWLIGGFVAGGRVYDHYLSSPAFMAGLETQYFCGNWTGYVQVGYMDANGDFDFLWNGGFVRGQVSYYASSKFKLSGGLAYIAGDSGFTDSGGIQFRDNSNQWAWQAEGRYLFGRSVPVAGFVRYEGRQVETHYGMGYTPQLTSNQVYVGFSWMFGGATDDLKTSDREGAGTDIMNFDRFRIIAD